MLSELFDYGAVATKVRAMYKNRLRPEDFAQITSMKKVADVVTFLRGHPGWKGAFDEGFKETRRRPLEDRLRQFVLSDYYSILHFLPRDDRFILQYRVLSAEMDELMLFLQLARAGRAAEYQCHMPDLFLRHSRFQFAELSRAKNYADFLAAAKRTKFYEALLRIAPDDGDYPSYTAVETIVRSHYFRQLFAYIDKHYKGRVRELLREAIGSQVDLINISTVVRIRHFHPNNDRELYAYLLPVHYKLRPSFIRSLYEADSDEQVMTLLSASAYGKFFSSQEFSHIEEYYYQFLYAFNRRHISDGIPSVYTPMAYLSLRDVELKNLINSIEFVRYGIAPSRAPAFLFGVPTQHA